MVRADLVAGGISLDGWLSWAFDRNIPMLLPFLSTPASTGLPVNFIWTIAVLRDWCSLESNVGF